MIKIETSNFKRLIGVWNTSGQFLSDNETMSLNGTDSYEIILEGNYILHKADVQMGNEKSETIEIIGLENTAGKAEMKFFNSKGESGIMTSQINDNDFQIYGVGIKFIGKFNTENSELVGKWLLQSEDKGWKEFIELRLEKRS